MMEQHRAFWICGGAEAVMKNLIGSAPEWYPTGSIDYARRNLSMVELTRFRLRSMTFEAREDAEFFGLELARLLVDTRYREFALARYEREEKLTRQKRFRR